MLAAAHNGGGAGAGAKANGQGKAQARGVVLADASQWQAAMVGVGGVVAGLLLAVVLQSIVAGKSAVPQVPVMHAAAHLRGSGAGLQAPVGAAAGGESKGAPFGQPVGSSVEGKDGAARHRMANAGTPAGVDARATAEGSQTTSQPDARSKHIHEAKHAKAMKASSHPVPDSSKRQAAAAAAAAASAPSPALASQQQQAQQQQQKKQQQQAV